jgi:hypothetical protein
MGKWVDMAVALTVLDIVIAAALGPPSQPVV